MPNGDKTGPAGKGPKTGGGLGGCEGAVPQTRPFDGRGAGQGAGRGRGAGQGAGRGKGLGRAN